MGRGWGADRWPAGCLSIQTADKRPEGSVPFSTHLSLPMAPHRTRPLSLCRSSPSIPLPLLFFSFPFPFPPSYHLSGALLPTSSTTFISLPTHHSWLALRGHSAFCLFGSLSLPLCSHLCLHLSPISPLLLPLYASQHGPLSFVHN